MSKIDVYPGSPTTVDDLQQAVDNFDEVLLHARDKNGAPNLTFDIGPNRILIRKPVTIEGVPDPRYPDEKPVITGKSGYLILDNAADGYPGAGIFSIVTKGTVNLTNLRLKHTPNPNPLAASMHGTATVAYFADNDYESNLTITGCDILSAATSSISIDAINPINLDGKHEIFIEGCQVKGLDQPSLSAYGAGNYIGVKIGAMSVGRPPLNMRRGHLAVKGCTVDSAKWAAVAAASFESDAKSKFDVSGNRIGCYPNSPIEHTTVGIIFLNAAVMDPALKSWAQGRINLAHNEIKLGGYFTFPWSDWSAGILVQVNTDLPDAAETTITDNSIYFEQSNLPVWPQSTPNATELVLDGIMYEDAAANGPTRGSVSIKRNTVVGNNIVKPLRGIWLHKGARGVEVADNDLRRLMASYSQIFIGKEAHDCFISGNHYGGLEPLAGAFMQKPVAVILCDGDQNRLSCTDFSGTGVPGWLLDSTGLISGGPGRIKLDANSESDDVEVDPTTYAVTLGNTIQWWNASVMQPNNNNVHVR
jgi:hypothetical protein